MLEAITVDMVKEPNWTFIIDKHLHEIIYE